MPYLALLSIAKFMRVPPLRYIEGFENDRIIPKLSHGNVFVEDTQFVILPERIAGSCLFSWDEICTEV